jgi:hypothetical protein
MGRKNKLVIYISCYAHLSILLCGQLEDTYILEYDDVSVEGI